MREIEDAREALDRVERHVKRSRFVLTHPKEAMDILHDVLGKPRRATPTADAEIAQEVANLIDERVIYLERLELHQELRRRA